MVYHAPQGRPASRPPMEYHGDIVLGRDCELAAPKKSHQAGTGQRTYSTEGLRSRARARARRERLARAHAAKINAMETTGEWMTARQFVAKYGCSKAAALMALRKCKKVGSRELPIYLVTRAMIARREKMLQRPTVAPATVVQVETIGTASNAPRPSIWFRLFGWVIGR